MSPVAAVVLAAGTASRMGGPKQLLPWRGEPLLAHVVRQALASRVLSVTVVLGYQGERMVEVLLPLAGPAGERLRWIHNPDYQQGLSSSVRAGIAALTGEEAGPCPGVSGVVFLLADQPLVRAEHIDSLVRRYEEMETQRGDRLILVPSSRGRRGNPVLFGRGFFRELSCLVGDEGGRSLFRSYPEAVIEVPAGKEVLVDLDTPGDYTRWSKGQEWTCDPKENS